MADSPRSCDLPLAKRPRLSEERSAGDVSTDHQLQAGAGSGTQASIGTKAQTPLTDSAATPDSGFRDTDSLIPAPDPDSDDDSCSSDLSDVSALSGSEWKPASTPIRWVQKQIEKGSLTPREILEQLLPNAALPAACDNVTLWRLIVSILSQPPKRKRLPHVNTVDHVVDLIRRSKRIIVLTGAGVSVSCGIPDFRSRDGVYARLSVEFPSLPDPQSMFDIHYFRRDPRPFFKFAKEIYPGQFEPSASHKFIRMIESQGKLLRNYTQNIDTLEEVCGLQRVINCHGSFSTASCTKCGFRVRAEQIKDDIFSQRIPLCPHCPADSDTFQMAVMKPDIVFFGEGLSDEFHSAMAADKDQCDLLLVMGSSLKVRPVALIPSSISPHVPQILINREPLNHMNFDVELLGDCDVIVQELSNRLGGSWTSFCESNDLLHEVCHLEPEQSDSLSLSSSSSTMAPDDPCSTTSCPPVRRIIRKSIADRLPENSFLFIPPARYVFRGAEVFDSRVNHNDDSDDNSCDWATVSEDSGSSDSSNSSSSSSSCSNPSNAEHGSSSGEVRTTRVSSSDWLQESSDFLFKVDESDT